MLTLFTSLFDNSCVTFSLIFLKSTVDFFGLMVKIYCLSVRILPVTIGVRVAIQPIRAAALFKCQSIKKFRNAPKKHLKE